MSTPISIPRSIVCSACRTCIALVTEMVPPMEPTWDSCENIIISGTIQNVIIEEEVHNWWNGMTSVCVNCITCNQQVAQKIIEGHPTILMYRPGWFIFEPDQLLVWNGNQFVRFFD